MTKHAKPDYTAHVHLEDLVGTHTLTAVEHGTEEVHDIGYGRDITTCTLRFTLDKVTYVAAEDPEDGWRSTLAWLRLSETPCRVSFAPVRVKARMKDEPHCTTLQLVHAKTGAVIVEAGTDQVDDWYPSCVLIFKPESLIG